MFTNQSILYELSSISLLYYRHPHVSPYPHPTSECSVNGLLVLCTLTEEIVLLLLYW